MLLQTKRVHVALSTVQEVTRSVTDTKKNYTITVIV